MVQYLVVLDMKKLLGIIILGLLLGSKSNADTCSKIFDYEENKRDFVLCLQSEYEVNNKGFKNKSKNLLDNIFGSNTEMNVDISIKDTFVKDGIDYECINLCKQSVKGGLTMKDLNAFCKFQCQK